jgi:hypothetical protein
MTAALAFAIGASVLFGSPIPIEVLLVPVGALFAFSQLRTTLPGLPEGIYSFVLPYYACD